MVRAGLALLAALVGACGLSIVGGEPTSSTPDGGDTPSPTPTASPTVSPPDAAVLLPRSCKEIHIANPALPDGIQKIDADGDGPNAPIDAWCDMTTSEGGWTLVGRSAPGGTGDFGWSAAAGMPADTTKPYALDVYHSGLTFEQILLRGENENVYRLEVPQGFEERLADTASTGGVTVVSGQCATSGSDRPEMFDHLGVIADKRVFFFRNNGTFDAIYGLRPDGWETYFNPSFFDCRGGGIDEDQGSILVR